MSVRELSNKNPDGTRLGQSTDDLISFYGKTPVDQPAHTDQAAITAGATTTACNNAVIALRAALVELGLIKGAA